jgi:hypothetical protein
MRTGILASAVRQVFKKRCIGSGESSRRDHGMSSPRGSIPVVQKDNGLEGLALSRCFYWRANMLLTNGYWRIGGDSMQPIPLFPNAPLCAHILDA